MIKKIIKSILPYGIVALLRKTKPKVSSLEKYKENIRKGNSILENGFSIYIQNPAKNKKYINIGDDCLLSCSILFESGQGEVSIGNRVFIGNSTIICRTKVEFENDIFVAWGTYFYDHDSHSLNYKDRMNDITQQINDHRAGKSFIETKNWNVVNTRPIRICAHAWIGMNCLILKGVTVGQGAIVGAGSVVTKNVPPWTIVAGNPAKVIKEIPNELRKK